MFFLLFHRLPYRRRVAAIVIAGLLIAFTGSVQTAYAYLTPEEVLLSEELYLPPRTREALDRVDRQQRVSNVRRNREQETLFPLEFPTEMPSMEESYTTSSMNGSFDELGAFDMELLRTLRLLERVEARQQVLPYGESLHSGAPASAYQRPDLAPTGPGSILSVLAMMGALGWTLRRAKKAEEAGVRLMRGR